MITILSACYNLVLEKSIQQFMNIDDFFLFFFDSQKAHLIQLNMVFFYRNLNTTTCVVVHMNNLILSLE